MRQALVSAHRDGARWNVVAVPTPPPANADVTNDKATFTLSPGGSGYWDFTCVREVSSDVEFDDYREPVEGTSRAEYVPTLTEHGKPYVKIRRGRVEYSATNGLCRDVPTAKREYWGEDFSPFEWVWLDVRKGTASARLELFGLPITVDAFATITDLHTGQERPAPLQRSTLSVVLEVPHCPARRLLRIYFPLT